MATTTTLITANELFRMPDNGRRYELVKGELVVMAPPGGEHGTIQVNFAVPFGQHVRANRLGVVCVEAGFQIASDPDPVLVPDVAFVRGDRMPNDGVPKSYWKLAPDLVVEVISPNDTYAEVEEKVEQWLDAGTLMVIVANPLNRTLKIYSSRTEVTVLTESD